MKATTFLRQMVITILTKLDNFVENREANEHSKPYVLYPEVSTDL